MTRAASIVDVNSVLNVAQRRCADHGVSVKFDSYAKTAFSDGKNITLPMIKQPITQEQLECLYGFIIHECGHHIRDDAFKILRSAQPPDHVCALYNIVEDDGMERERALEWRGDKKALSQMNSILTEDVAISWENAIANLRDTSNQPPEPLAAMAIGRLAALDWDGANDVVTDRLISCLPDTAKDLVKELANEDWVKRMRQGTSPDETWDITIDLVKRLYPDHDEDQYEEMRKDGHDKTPASQQSRDKSNDPRPGDEDGAGEADGSGDAGPEDGESSDNGKRKEDGRVISWKDVVLSEHNEWEPSDGPPGGFGIDWTDKTGDGSVVLMPTNKVNVVDLATRKSEREKKDDCWSNPNHDKFMPTDESARAFANRVRRYIQSQARSVVEKEKYHGRLDRGALVRLALPPIDGGEYNKRIFYDQRKHTMKDTAIFVLTDWSGSMNGHKMHYAADASQRLVHTFDRVLNVPVALAAFTNRNTPCDIGYIKKFNTRGVPAIEIAKRFADFYAWSSANNDADSVHWAYNELLKRKESRKLLLVLSDGCPAGSWGGNSYENLRYVTNSIEQAGKVELYGVGICSDAVKGYYTNNRVLNSPEEINETLFNIIKEGNNVTTSGRR